MGGRMALLKKYTTTVVSCCVLRWYEALDRLAASALRVRSEMRRRSTLFTLAADRLEDEVAAHIVAATSHIGELRL
jgi:hypothetical protein